MNIYEIDPSPREHDTGESREEYLTSRAEVIKRVAELIDERMENPDEFSFCSVVVRHIEVADLPPRKLTLAILNNKGWIAEHVKVLDLGTEWFREHSGKNRYFTLAPGLFQRTTGASGQRVACDHDFSRPGVFRCTKCNEPMH